MEGIGIQSYTVCDGLSSNLVQYIYQDSKGFIWIGTNNGLNRYDGYNFKTYRYNPKNDKGIQGNDILFISEDFEGNVCVGINEYGLSCKINGKPEFVSYFDKTDLCPNLQVNKISTIHISEQGKIYFGLNDYIYIKDYSAENDSSKCFKIPYEDSSSQLKSLLSFDDKIIIATTEGAFVFDNKVFSKLNVDNYQSSGFEIFDLVKIYDNKILITTDVGAFILNRDNDLSQLCKTDFTNIRTAIKSPSEIWLSIDNIVYILNLKSGVREEIFSLPKNVVITTLLQDRSGVLWVGTSFDGLFKFINNAISRKVNNILKKNESSYEEYQNVITTYAEDESTIWIGTGDNKIGLVKYQYNNKFYKNILVDNLKGDLKSIFKGPNNEILVSTDYGIFRADKNSQNLEEFRSTWTNDIIDSLSNFVIYDYAKDTYNSDWLITSQGICSVENDSIIRLYGIDNEIGGESESMSLFLDRQNKLYVISHYSVYQFDYENSSFFDYLDEDFLHGHITSVATDYNNDFWLGTNIGLYKLTNNERDSVEIVHIEGLGYQKINSVLIDEYDRVWCALSNNIALVMYDGGIRMFDRQDGVDTRVFNKNSRTFTKSGALMFGAVDGLYVIEPDSIKYNLHQPPIQILDAKIFYKSNKQSKLPINNNDLSFHIKKKPGMMLQIDFAALDYHQTEKNNFQFFLQGYDNGWQAPSTSNSAVFTNLTSGKYNLKVRASNNDFIWSDTILEIPIVIYSPLWLSKIAYVFYAFVLALIIQIFVNYRIRHYRHDNLILKEKNIDRLKLEEKQDQLTKIHRNVTDSINYALRIQRAIMPSLEKVKEILPTSFLYFRPKDIVSGDFYWMHKTKKRTYIAVVDCTGHGVPGGFMSIIGVDLLKYAIIRNKEVEPGKILDILSSELNTSLGNNLESDNNFISDSMDLSLCVIDHRENNIKFAGAMHNLYMIRNDELNIFKGDRRVIGSIDENLEFNYSTIEIAIEPGDRFYMFTDGYTDQFGGPESKKYMSRRFRHLLLNIHQMDFETQKKLIHKNFEDWRGHEEQVDDVLVLGFQI